MTKITSLFGILFLPAAISINCSAQTSNDLDDASNWKLSYHHAIGRSNEKQNSESWYKKSDSYSFELGVSRRLKKLFWIQSGISYDTYRFQSEPYIHSGTSTYYTQTPTGLVGVSYNFTDDFERISKQSSGYLSLPLSINYMSESKWGFYARAGFKVSFPMFSIDQNLKLPDESYISYYDIQRPIGTEATLSIFSKFSAGFKLKTTNTSFLIGMTYDGGLFRTGGGYLPHALRADMGIHVNLNKRVSENVENSSVSEKSRRSYLYAQIGGSLLIYSLNYEYSLFGGDKNRLNFRVGVSILDERFDIRSGIAPIKFVSGMAWNHGKTHVLEVGINFMYDRTYGGDGFHFSPTVAYRFEPANAFFMRVSASYLFFPQESYCETPFDCGLPWPGLSLGVHL
jgi:hypothetical protein